MKVTKHVEQLLRQGHKPKELVALGFSKRVVTRVRRRLRVEKAVSQGKWPAGAPQTETRLETPPESPEKIATIWQKVQSMANDLKRIDGLVQALSEATILVAAAKEFGTYMYDICPHNKDGLCTLETWLSKEEIPGSIGEPVLVGNEKPEWYIRPSPLYCAMCPIPFEDHLDDVESKVSGDPLAGARDITCMVCGTKGLVATSIKCTKCGHETYRGWWPKKD